MGAYLAKPVTTKQSFDDAKGKLSCGGSEMQGWRVSMEDAHSCILDYDDDLSLFAVYDGHGGSEVATYTAENLPNFLKTTDEFKDGNLKECLKNSFLQFDEQLISEGVMTKLREMAGLNDTQTNDSEVNALRQEAELPIHELMSKLKEGGYHIDNIEDDDDDDEEDDEEEDQPDEKEGGESSGNVKDSLNNNHNKKEKEIVEDEKPALKDEKPAVKDEKPAVKAKSSDEVQETKDEKVNGKKTEDEQEAVDEENEEEEDEDDESEEDEEDDDADDEEEGTQWHEGDEVGFDSGTTAVVALLRKDKLVVANVGDSRCVLCRNGVAIDMSIDHKPDDDDELKRIQNAGGKVTAEGRVNGGLNLSRALGDHRYKGKSDLGPDEQQITAFPDVKETEITEADKFVVLACDGIWNVLTSQEVVDFVSERLEKQSDSDTVSLSKICEELLDRCLSSDTSGDGTGCDNMTAIIVLLTSHKNFKHKGKRKAEVESDENEAKKPKTE